MFSSKVPKFAEKITELEFPGNMHIYKLFPKCLHIFFTFYSGVKEEVCCQIFNTGQTSKNSLQRFKGGCTDTLFITLINKWTKF